MGWMKVHCSRPWQTKERRNERVSHDNVLTNGNGALKVKRGFSCSRKKGLRPIDDVEQVPLQIGLSLAFRSPIRSERREEKKKNDRWQKSCGRFRFLRAFSQQEIHIVHCSCNSSPSREFSLKTRAKKVTPLSYKEIWKKRNGHFFHFNALVLTCRELFSM